MTAGTKRAAVITAGAGAGLGWLAALIALYRWLQRKEWEYPWLTALA